MEITSDNRLIRPSGREQNELRNIEFISNDQLVLSAPLIAIESVEAKGFFGRIWARIVFWIMSLFSVGK